MQYLFAPLVIAPTEMDVRRSQGPCFANKDALPEFLDGTYPWR